MAGLCEGGNEPSGSLKAISSIRQNASYEVYEEVGCISSDDSTRRVDIVIIDRQKDKGVILDPTIRFEMYEQQPQERRWTIPRGDPDQRRGVPHPGTTSREDDGGASGPISSLPRDCPGRAALRREQCDSDVRFELTTSVPQEGGPRVGQRGLRGALWDGARRREVRGKGVRGEGVCARIFCLPREAEKSLEVEESRIRTFEATSLWL
ncbi:hypothetical protein ANN_10439 [Periplaneta americana]|uniref:Uncharacterized protein n=1 Tax=Periplaneta americana TaxID=6978 RepID=A0ABQ8TP05_PERAM|nr:hypothetical protein ANN_10439 [Periplaneta americana]